MVERSMLNDGSVELRSERARFVYTRLHPGVLLITISGDDTGQFGTATLDEISAEHERFGEPLQLFVDTREALGPATNVMEMWTAWLVANRAKLRGLMVLVPAESKLLHLTVSIAKHLSRTGDLLSICSELSEFREAMRRETSARAV